MNSFDSISAGSLLDVAAHVALAGGAFAAVAALAGREASTRLECALLGVLGNAVALVLWNVLLGPAEACARWRAAAVPLLLFAVVLSYVVAGARIPSRRYVSGASALLGLFWINGLLR